jgi:hypothetical protein
MEDWGKLCLKNIEKGCDFWHLFDELMDDESGFFNNRGIIVEAYKEGNLFGLRVGVTDSMYKRDAIFDDIFCRPNPNLSYYLLPCFCIKQDNKAIIIWTHTRARRKGFAKKLIELLNIEYADNPLPGSIKFWEKCNSLRLFKGVKLLVKRDGSRNLKDADGASMNDTAEKKKVTVSKKRKIKKP